MGNGYVLFESSEETGCSNLPSLVPSGRLLTQAPLLTQTAANSLPSIFNARSSCSRSKTAAAYLPGKVLTLACEAVNKQIDRGCLKLLIIMCYSA